ncbi:MAG: hypothetical protein QM758_00295 [Armatimonas sp.]
MIAGTICFLGAGCKGLADSAKFKKPVTMSCEQFLNNSPKEGWYKVTGCIASLPDGAYETIKFGDSKPDPKHPNISNVWIPLYPVDQSKVNKSLAGKTSVLLKSNRPDFINISEEMAKLEASETDEAKLQKKMLAFLEKNEKKLVFKRDFQGMVEAGFDLSESEHAEIAKLQEDDLSPNFVVLKEGASPPTPIAAIGEIILGILCGLGSLVMGIGMFTPNQKQQEPLADNR